VARYFRANRAQSIVGTNFGRFLTVAVQKVKSVRPGGGYRVSGFEFPGFGFRVWN
jgi:hypothetical protein